jgi:hypothetical protein
MQNFKTYTFITDWDGGTYLSQTMAIDLNSALDNWINLLIQRNDLNLSLNLIDSFIVKLRDSELVSIEGLFSVWCTSILLDEKIAIIHVVLTDAKS